MYKRQGFQVPNPPGGDDLHLGGKRFDGQLKTDLVVALAGAAVADSVRAFRQSDFHDSLGDNGTGKGGSQQILSLVNRARFYRGENIIFYEYLVEIFNIQFGGAGFLGFFLQAFQLRALPYVSGYGNYFAIVVIFFEPWNNDGCKMCIRDSCRCWRCRC